jgi:hypothetical protein
MNNVCCRRRTCANIKLNFANSTALTFLSNFLFSPLFVNPFTHWGTGNINVYRQRQINNQVDIKRWKKNSREEDISEIFRLYKIATDFRRQGLWGIGLNLKRSLVETEIAERRQWKIVIDNKIACVWYDIQRPTNLGRKTMIPHIYS